MRVFDTVMATCAVAFAGISVYLFRRLRLLEARLTSTAKLHLSALTTLQNTMDAVATEVVQLRPADPPPLRHVSLAVQAPPNPPRVGASSSCSSDRGSIENDRGYHTADEDVDGEPYPAAAQSAMPTRGEATRDSPVRIEAWAARSVMGGDGSWSCVDGGGAAPSSSTASGMDEAASAKQAAEAAILARVDSMYLEQEYDNAFELLAGAADETAEVLWRKTRVLKELAGIAKQGGAKKKCEAMWYEALGFASRALELDRSNFACHKWYAIAISETSSCAPRLKGLNRECTPSRPLRPRASPCLC